MHNSNRKKVSGDSGLLCCRVVLVAILFAWILLVLVGDRNSLAVWARLLIVTTVVDAVIVKIATRSQWSAGFMSFLPLAIFHVGLYVEPALTGRVPAFVVTTGSDWFLWANHQLLTGLIAVGLTSFALGCISVQPWVSEESRQRLRDDQVQRNACEKFSNWGGLLLVISVGLWFLVGIRVGGVTFFLMSYRNYLTAVQGGFVGLTYIGIGLGLVFTVMNLRSAMSRVAIASFVIFSLAGFPLGLRGEVLMPFVGALVVHMHLQAKRPRWVLLLGSGVVLSSISVARQVRKIGLGEGLSGLNLRVGPLDAIEELGASSRVLNTSIDWHSNGGEPFLLGRTYYTFALRLFNSVLGVENVDAWSDFGLMNVEIGTRVGNIGGSLFGEAHHNFGLMGVVILPFLFGLLLAALAKNATTARGLAVLGVAVVLLMMHVRNTFGPLLIWGIVAVVIILLASRPVNKKQPDKVLAYQ